VRSSVGWIPRDCTISMAARISFAYFIAEYFLDGTEVLSLRIVCIVIAGWRSTSAAH